jgi:hypothetical protein
LDTKKNSLIGTFISDWLVKNWSDETWRKELTAMQEIGIEYLILAPTVLFNKDGKWLVNYPTQIEGAKDSYDGIDLVENILRNAKKFNIKVLFGLNMDDKWWENWWDVNVTTANREWLYKQMKLGNIVADELYSKYHSRYPDIFIGWYWVWEMWNFSIMTLDSIGRNQNIQTLTNCLNITLDHLTKLDKSMPVLFSPFANLALNTIEDVYHMWKDIFASTKFRNGDIFCPQDSVGAGGTKLSQLRECFMAFKKAVDTKPGLKLWANNENFEQSDWSSATLDRFIQQIKITSEFAEHNITFAYNNYYSPLNTDKGFHETFKYYVNNGKLPIKLPQIPLNVTQSIDNDKSVIRWTECESVAGYLIYKNSKLIGSVKCNKDDGKGYIEKMNCIINDADFCNDSSAEYAVCSFDFAGNLSLQSKATKNSKQYRNIY